VGADIRHLGPDLFLIVLDPPISGFQEFIGVWLVRRPGAVYLVDVGPAATVDQLAGALSTVGVNRLDYICLTHIHMDHAGAIGHLALRFKEARVVCHPKGSPHIVDPERLWQGTVKTLGKTGRAYGRMLPVEPERVATDAQLASAPFRLIDTPGHSPHHFAIAADDYLFAGEAGGVCLTLPTGDAYLRPATPPRFFLETTLASLDRLLAEKCDTICYGHLGMRKDGMALLARHREQLLFWERTLAEEAAGGTMDAPEFERRWVDRLLAEDPRLQGFDELPHPVKLRERYFMTNSVKGFAGYLNSNPR
jgi:glyoxylase-like metal-dependent hydrolase (beta-lactamase superfamily II)